jgi:signal transduction histidine kinase
LRAPVSLIRTTAELAIQSGRSNSEYHEDMVQILAEAERTTRLIDSLLLLARADAGEGGLQHDLIDISTSVREAVAQGRGFAVEKRVNLTADLNSSPVVRGDGEALRRLFLILIDNAVKYTPEGGTVELRQEAANGKAAISVTDSGIGIAESDLPHIFDRFWRADKVRSRGMGGAGLGLSIARWIVDKHQGSIEVQSQPGKGSTFTVRIPLDNTSDLSA